MEKILQYLQVRPFFWAKDADSHYLHTSCLTQTHLQNIYPREAKLLEGSSSYRNRDWSLVVLSCGCSGQHTINIWLTTAYKDSCLIPYLALAEILFYEGTCSRKCFSLVLSWCLHKNISMTLRWLWFPWNTMMRARNHPFSTSHNHWVLYSIMPEEQGRNINDLNLHRAQGSWRYGSQHLPSATHPLHETQCKQQEKTAETHLRYLGGWLICFSPNEGDSVFLLSKPSFPDVTHVFNLSFSGKLSPRM